MQSELAAVYRATRRQYELGRLARALRHAGMLTLALAAISEIAFGRRALVWLPIAFVVTVFTEWRGSALMRGARRGLAAGVASMLLPLSVLRPCCGIDAKAMGMDCCVMPSACWAAGTVLGLGMALIVPAAPEGRRTEVAVGMILGVTSVAVLRCSMLFLGETAGLLGGMVAGVIASSLARAWLARGLA
jgi:hypothetical protein